jgi:predicted Fe-Mo cluster-binding NifX family protein
MLSALRLNEKLETEFYRSPKFVILNYAQGKSLSFSWLLEVQ